MSRKLTAALVGVTTAISLAATASPASAATVHNVSYQGAVRGSGKFEPQGEIITVKDLKADGLSVWVRYSYYKGQQFEDGWCINKSGNGSTKTCNLSIAEGTLVDFRLQVVDGSEPRAAVYWSERA